METTPKTKEAALRIYRFLNYRQEHHRPSLVNGYELSDQEKELALTPEATFEATIANLYQNPPSYTWKRWFLMRPWPLLDRLFGSVENRLYRHQFLHYCDLAEVHRKNYQEYLRRDYHYEDASGRRHQLGESRFNENTLEALLPEDQWMALQEYKYGGDHAPSENYDRVVYHKRWEQIPTPSPAVIEWLAKVGGVEEFERSPVG